MNYYISSPSEKPRLLYTLALTLLASSCSKINADSLLPPPYGGYARPKKNRPEATPASGLKRNDFRGPAEFLFEGRFTSTLNYSSSSFIRYAFSYYINLGLKAFFLIKIKLMEIHIIKKTSKNKWSIWHIWDTSTQSWGSWMVICAYNLLLSAWARAPMSLTI